MAIFLIGIWCTSFHMAIILNAQKLYVSMFSSVRDTYMKFHQINPIGIRLFGIFFERVKKNE